MLLSPAPPHMFNEVVGMGEGLAKVDFIQLKSREPAEDFYWASPAKQKGLQKIMVFIDREADTSFGMPW